jgi:hypothetical protein
LACLVTNNETLFETGPCPNNHNSHYHHYYTIALTLSYLKKAKTGQLPFIEVNGIRIIAPLPGFSVHQF